MGNKKSRSIPFWGQIVIILLCGVAISGAVYGAIRYIKWRQYEESLPKYTVTFAYQNGDVIATKQTKAGRGVLPPILDSSRVFQGWSKPINNVMADMEVHPLYYSIEDENLFCFDSVYVREGDEFTITVLLTGKVNISSAELSIEYDPDVMTFIEADSSDLCTVSCLKDGKLTLLLRSEKPIVDTMTLSDIKFKAQQHDVYSSQIDFICKEAKVNQSGVEVPATASTLNNKIFYLQEVD